MHTYVYTHIYIIYMAYTYIYVFMCTHLKSSYCCFHAPNCIPFLLPSAQNPRISHLELVSPRLDIETHSWHGCESPGLPKVRCYLRKMLEHLCQDGMNAETSTWQTYKGISSICFHWCHAVSIQSEYIFKNKTKYSYYIIQ